MIFFSWLFHDNDILIIEILFQILLYLNLIYIVNIRYHFLYRLQHLSSVLEVLLLIAVFFSSLC